MFENNIQLILLILLIAYTAWNHYKSNKTKEEDSVTLEGKLENLHELLSFDPAVARMFANDTVFWELFELHVPAVTARPFLNRSLEYAGKIPNSAVRVLLLYLQEVINPTSGEKT